jgi:hypothetical protein
MNKKYWTKNNEIIFINIFNDEIINYYSIIKKSEILVFSNFLGYIENDYYKEDYEYEEYCAIRTKNENFNFLRKNSSFNNKVNNIPDSIKQLYLGSSFNNKVDNLTNNLTKLIFNGNFNRKNDFLVNSLTVLRYGSTFNFSINNSPKNLNSLCFGENFNKPINKLPQKITFIRLEEYFSHKIKKFPPKLKTISCCIAYRYIDDLSDYDVEQVDYY